MGSSDCCVKCNKPITKAEDFPIAYSVRYAWVRCAKCSNFICNFCAAYEGALVLSFGTPPDLEKGVPFTDNYVCFPCQEQPFAWDHTDNNNN